MESIDSFISENNLEFTKNKNNGTPKTITYKIAFEPRVAFQRYGNTDEHVTIHFNQQDCSFLQLFSTILELPWNMENPNQTAAIVDVIIRNQESLMA